MATHGTTVDSRAGGGPADQQMSRLLAQNWWAFAIRGVLGIFFSFIANFQPGVTMLSLVLVFSAYAFIDGIFAIIASVRAARQHEKWGFLALEGIVNIIASIIAFLWPGITVLSFVFLVGTWAILSGGLMLGAALRFNIDHGRWWLVLGGLASVSYGVAFIGASLIRSLVLDLLGCAHADVVWFSL